VPLTHVSRSTWYVLVAIYVSMFAMTMASVQYTRWSADQNNRRWCGVLRVYHEAYQLNPPPSTQAGRDIQAQLEQLYTDFHCASAREP
jgi:hypothetical protein